MSITSDKNANNKSVDYKKLIGAVAVVALVAAAAFLTYNYTNQPEEVTTMTQEQAESVAGVEKAAEHADVPISTSQAKEIATQIREIRTTEKVPVYVVQSTGATVEKDIKTAKEQAKADFAIVTEKDKPDEAVDLKQIDKDAAITLNQYNINAYPKALRQLEVGKSTDGGTVVGASISKKVTDNGQYLGVGVDYDTANARAMVKMIYTW